MSTLRQARKAKSLTLEQASKAVGTDIGNLSRIERGLQACGLALASRIATLYGVSEIAVLYPERAAQEPEGVA